MRTKTPKLLEDIRDAAAYIGELAQGRTLEDYQRDRMLRQTIERNFEIIGEAVNRLLQHEASTTVHSGRYPQPRSLNWEAWPTPDAYDERAYRQRGMTGAILTNLGFDTFRT